jgi:hypothetical protein
MSGGQTGVDRAALDAALATGIPCGGWCPAGRLAEDGPIADRYPLTETESQDYAERTQANVRDSEATLIIDYGPFAGPNHNTSAGTRLTAEAAKKFNRPLYIADLAANEIGTRILTNIYDWIGEYNISNLNIAGPRESECPGIYDAAHGLLLKLFAAIARR